MYLKDIREVRQNHTHMEQVAVEDPIDLVLLVDIMGNSLEVMAETGYFHQLLELDIIGVAEEVVHHGMSPPEEAEVQVVEAEAVYTMGLRQVLEILTDIMQEVMEQRHPVLMVVPVALTPEVEEVVAHTHTLLAEMVVPEL
jgi:hypothetical protein